MSTSRWTAADIPPQVGTIHLDDPNNEHRRYQRRLAYGQAKLANLMFAYELQLPTLHAATVSDLPGGSYVGPDGVGGTRGYPRPVGSTAASHDHEVQRKLWERSEELTGVRFDVAGMPS